MTILVSRTDSIGDVVLTLPLVGAIKRYLPSSKVIFLGKSYTKAVIELCDDIDEFLNWDDLRKDLKKAHTVLQNKNINTAILVFPDKQIAKVCKKAKIKYRIGTSHRVHNLLYCNRLINFSRRKSNEHEAILNLKLLNKVSGLQNKISFDNITELLNVSVKKSDYPKGYISENEDFKYVILHPKSNGSAREWGLENFKTLINLLDKTKFRIFVCGTESEGELFRQYLFDNKIDNVYDLSGQLSLEEYISLINDSDFLIAASTGPLHIAAILNKHAIGLFPPIRPMDPGRWRPIGKNVKIFCKEKSCNICRKDTNCECVKSIPPKDVADYIISTCKPNS